MGLEGWGVPRLTRLVDAKAAVKFSLPGSAPPPMACSTSCDLSHQLAVSGRTGKCPVHAAALLPLATSLCPLSVRPLRLVRGGRMSKKAAFDDDMVRSRNSRRAFVVTRDEVVGEIHARRVDREPVQKPGCGLQPAALFQALPNWRGMFGMAKRLFGTEMAARLHREEVRGSCRAKGRRLTPSGRSKRSCISS